jgi:hypothetical protein
MAMESIYTHYRTHPEYCCHPRGLAVAGNPGGAMDPDCRCYYSGAIMLCFVLLSELLVLIEQWRK